MFSVFLLVRCQRATDKKMKVVPRATSHTRTVSSNPPDTSKLDEGLKLTQNTKLVCPLRTLTMANCVERKFWSVRTQKTPRRTSSTLQIYIVLSSDADARNSPSNDQATSDTPSVWPSSVSMSSPCSTSHTLTSLSAASSHKSGEAMRRGSTHNTTRVSFRPG